MLGVAIVGPGKVAHTHAAALGSLSNCRLQAVCGRSLERARALAGQYGARAYARLEDVLADDGVDIVIICTPHPQHAEAAIAAARAGRHVLVEKPMALTSAECRSMIAAARQAGVKLGVISQRRWLPPVQRMKAAIQAGKIGRPALGLASLLGWRGPEYYAMDAWRGTWAGEGGGVLVNQAPHQLDLLQWLMGPIAEIHGYWSNLNHPEIEVEDTAVAVLRFQSGALGSLVASNSQRPGLQARVQVSGTSGATLGVQTDGGSMFVAGLTAPGEPAFIDVWTVPGEEALLPAWQAEDRAHAARVDASQHYHALQLADFVDAVLSDRSPAVAGEDGLRVVEMFEAIYRAQASGRPVRLPLDE